MLGLAVWSRPKKISSVAFSAAALDFLKRTAKLSSACDFIARDAEPTATNDDGYMTSVAFSPSCGHWTGLGLLKRGPARLGEILRAYDPIRGEDTLVEVVAPCFVDPEGAKLRG
jgi:methylglutamate dehydrogenase subunit C